MIWRVSFNATRQLCKQQLLRLLRLYWGLLLMISQRADLTFKYNLKHGRHSWLRLTPAYSIKIVQQILAHNPTVTHVLDPFSGTGTTGLVCAENNVSCDLTDINPFLIWFAKAKTTNYKTEDLCLAQENVLTIQERALDVHETATLWFPPIHNITRWWSEKRLITLAKIYQAINQVLPHPSPARDLLLIAFCNLIIQWSNAAFNHQSMSFKDTSAKQLSLFDEEQEIIHQFSSIAERIIASARTPLEGTVRTFLEDARQLHTPDHSKYDCVITSPPYPNRMSYIRELRPYMYWLGYLTDGREAGELDWQAIGGTWGIATSRLQSWESNGTPISYPGFEKTIADIANQSPVLANYVHRYFVDVSEHLQNLYPLLLPGARVFYIVGNSRFYETVVPVEKIYAALLSKYGFTDTQVEVIRKRNSKKELFEYIVSAVKPK